MIQSTGKWISRFATDARMVSGFCGLAAGTAWVSVSAVWWSSYEPLWPARAAWAVAFLAALMLLSASRVQTLLARVPEFWRAGIASCGFASWPALWRMVAARRELLPQEWFTQDLTAWGATSLLAGVAIFPVVLLGCLPVIEAPCAHQRRVPGGSAFWLGVAGAWALMPTTLFSRISADRGLFAVSAVMLLAAGLSLLLKREEPDTTPEPVELARPSWRLWAISLLMCGVVAVAIESALRISEQLVMDSLPFKLIGWSGFLVGMALSQLGIVAEPTTSLRRTLFGLGLACGAVCWLFPTWITLAIWSSATVSSFAAIVITKGLIPFVCLAPLGWVFGRLVRLLHPTVALLAAGLAWGFASHGGLPVGTVMASTAGLALLCSLTLWPRDSWQHLFRSRGRSWATPQVALTAVLLMAAWWGRSGVDLNLSSQLVFNPESFAALASGHDLDTIQRSDRSRLVKSINTEGDHWTLWRQRGSHFVVRRNGMVISGMTADIGAAPQNMWPVLTSLVPLVLHPQADHVLCVAPTGMAEIDSLLTFPIQSLTCACSDTAQLAVLREQASLAGLESRLRDGRVEWQTIAPSNLAHSRSSNTYDVIIAPEWGATPLSHQPQLTVEFHTAMAARLREEGIFCQRLSIFDFGSGPLIETLRSLSAAFRQVSILTTDGNELLLLATNSEYPLVDQTLVQRLETPHVRRLCAQIGGDWSMVTQLTYVTPEKVREMTTEAAPGNGALSGQFALRLASDVLRWGPKWKEKQPVFADRATLVLVAMGLPEDTQQIIARRIQDTQARQKILTETPDNQWVYRKELKDALKNRPRTKIQKVNNEIRQTFDEYDQQRKAYLLALGTAARQPQPTPESISAVEKFAEPYDPLLTEFVHFEAAHLLGRTATPEPAREYHNWQYCIGYAPANDRSVRPIVAAMDLLRRNPEIVSDPELRWEQHSALLDAMRLRWVNRWQQSTNSKFDPADMQNSSVAISATLSTMDDLASQAGIDSETWKVQRQTWEDTLLSPLRSKQGSTPPPDQMLESVRQEIERRNSELGDSK